jgi:hypothetical protein
MFDLALKPCILTARCDMRLLEKHALHADPVLSECVQPSQCMAPTTWPHEVVEANQNVTINVTETQAHTASKYHVIIVQTGGVET